MQMRMLTQRIDHRASSQTKELPSLTKRRGLDGQSGQEATPEYRPANYALAAVKQTVCAI